MSNGLARGMALLSFKKKKKGKVFKVARRLYFWDKNAF